MSSITKAVLLKDQPLYHSRVLGTTVPAGDLAYFKTPIGGTEDGTVLTDAETNNTFAGALPEGEYIRITGFSVRMVSTAGVPFADARAMLENSRSVFILRIAQSEFFKIPLRDIPSGNGLWSDFGGSSTGAPYWTNGLQTVRNIYKLVRPIVLPTQRPFDVIVRIYQSVTLSAPCRLYVYLHGLQRVPAFK